jgi:hypothetical protein
VLHQRKEIPEKSLYELPISLPSTLLFSKRQKGNASSTLNGNSKLSLMPHTISGGSPRNNSTPFREKTSEQPHILKVQWRILVAKSTKTTTLKKSPSLHRVSPYK